MPLYGLAPNVFKRFGNTLNAVIIQAVAVDEKLIADCRKLKAGIITN